MAPCLLGTPCLLCTLVRCPLGTTPPPTAKFSGCPTYGSLTRKKQGGTLGLNHMHMTCKTVRKNVQAVPRVMQKKQAVPHVAKKKLFHMSCKKQAVPHACKNHAKNKLFHMLQKPCKKQAVPHAKTNAKCGAYGAPTRRTSLFPGSLLYVLCAIWVLHAKPLNLHSPGFLLYVLYVLYLTRQATEHPLSPGFLAICAVCAMCYRFSRVQNI